MQFDFMYPGDVWAVMPAPGETDAAWVDEQAALAPPELRELAREWAAVALEHRREGITTSLYFRPPGLVCRGILHITFNDLVVDESDFHAEDWIPLDTDPAIAPVVAEFHTDEAPHGYRVAYISRDRDSRGNELAGLVYGLRFSTGIGTAFAELADRETIGLMQWQADPLISSIRPLS